MGYQYDTSAWPVVQFRFIGRLDVNDSNRYFDDANAVIRSHRRYACVMDGSTMLLPEVEFVRRQALWLREHREQIRAVNVGIAFVASSALIRGLVRAVLHLQPLSVPYASFSELERGVAWARTRTYDAGVSLLPPPERVE